MTKGALAVTCLYPIFSKYCSLVNLVQKKSTFIFLANLNKSKPVLLQGNNFSCATNKGSFA